MVVPMVALTASPPSALLANASQAGAPLDLLPFLYRTAAKQRKSRAGYVLFLLATAALLLRPADLFPSLRYVPIYQTIVLLCIAFSVSRLLYQLSPRSPARPITLLIIGICGSVVLSHLARGSLYDVRIGGIEFFKVLLYYLLVLAWVDSAARLRQFMLCLLACCLALTIAGWLDYDGWIHLPSLAPAVQADTDPASGAVTALRRLAGTGIFGDPNDLCLLLVTAIALSFAFIEYKAIGSLRFAWLIPISLFGYAVTLTASRGGFLALLSAGATILLARLGKARATLAAAMLLPILLILFAGRQTRAELSDPNDTFQIRLDYWSDSLYLFMHSPVFGCGQDQQVELRGQVAHNSFVQSFAELGFVGGTCFLGAFILTIRGIRQSTKSNSDSELARLRPYMLGIVVGYAIGLFALSRAYTASTYLVLGLGAAYINLTPSAIPLQLNPRCLSRLCIASVLFIAATYVFVRVMSA
jgi:putative inorganic carbon (hco3(-)) transporter